MGGQQAKEANAPAPPSGGQQEDAVGMTTSPAKEPTNKVQLAVTQIGPGAYHSSVTVNGEEFSFSDAGITSMPGLYSHRNPQQPNSKPQVFEMGMSHTTGHQMKKSVEQYFLPGTYDLLRKNCNSFSDCALFRLLNIRLDNKYRALEQLGAKSMSLVQAASGGKYTPNPKADGFELEQVIAALDPKKVWATPGQATGGSTADSAESMRAARLARFSQGSGGGAPGGEGACCGPSSAAGAAAAPQPPPQAPPS